MSVKSATFTATAIMAGVLAAVMIAEAGLQIAGFQPGRVNSGYLQFGYQDGIPKFDEDGVRAEGRPAKIRLFEPDAELLWVPIANTEFTNSQGLRGSVEYEPTKPAGHLRIVFIGDSCSFLGDPVYPELVERDLAAQLGRPVQSLNASSPGYSSLQGLRLLERVRRWNPDVVVVYFGWNDHWRAQGGLTDNLQMSLGHGLKVAALLRAAWASRQPAVNRVPVAQYEENLAQIRDQVHSWGAVPVFITAPTAFRPGEMPKWAYSFFQQFYAMDQTAIDAIPATHAAYVEAVRRTAAHSPAILVDAAADFAAADVPSARLFRTDSIHLRTAGHERLAKLLTATLAPSLQQRP